ncbi:MAG TPA: anibiotic ABC transporter, partial [Acidimicrobiaceae bacterium]|nr:anibiotic ABC transporter [Acidimicrobiaceae bacterium]
MGTDALVGGRRLLRLALRRDRVRIAVWAASTAAIVGLSAVSVRDLYDTVERRRGYALLARDNAAIIVQAGPGYGLDGDPSVGAILMNEVGVWTFILVAVLGLMMTTRHPRNEEETGRAELLRAKPIGRHAA